MFPAAMLAGMIVKGSLKNVPGGFEVKLRNNIDSGTLTGIGALGVDDQSIAPAQLLIKVGEKEVRADQLGPRSPLPVRVMSEIHLRVEGEPLAAGAHKLTFMLMTAEAGRLQFAVTEPLAEA